MGWASGRDFLAALALDKFFYGFTDVFFSMGASDTQFLVYQFKPVLQFLRQARHGLLIADEVGLGKTIEAALILREMMARGAVERVLIACPAALVPKWRDEMRNRFSIEFRHLRRADFADLQERAERDGAWPRFFGVASIETLRSLPGGVLADPRLRFDLVIVDEAHHLRNPQTASHGAGESLSHHADHILLLSATPLQTGAQDLMTLLRLAAPEDFADRNLDDFDAFLEPNAHINGAAAALAALPPDLGTASAAMRRLPATAHGQAYADSALFDAWLRRLGDGSPLNTAEIVRLRRDLQSWHTLAPYYTRTRKREVAEAPERRAHLIRVPLGDEEARFYDAWCDFITARAHHLQPGLPAGFALVQRERFAASSLHAAAARIDDLAATADDYEGSDTDILADDAFDAPRRPVVSLSAAERAVRAAAAALPDRDTKIEKLVAAVRDLIGARPDRKILVFGVQPSRSGSTGRGGSPRAAPVASSSSRVSGSTGNGSRARSA